MKEKTKKYLKRLGIAYLLAMAAFIFKICRNTKINDFYTLTPDTFISGTYDIYDECINKVGQITYEKQGEQLVVSIVGDEINGVTRTSKEPYNFKKIEYKEIRMDLKKYEDENYYYYDTGESIILICLLRPWFTHYSTFESLSKKRSKSGRMKDRQTFMFLISDYSIYNYALQHPSPTLQNYYTYPGGLDQLYRCYFIQEDEI